MHAVSSQQQSRQERAHATITSTSIFNSSCYYNPYAVTGCIMDSLYRPDRPVIEMCADDLTNNINNMNRFARALITRLDREAALSVLHCRTY